VVHTERDPPLTRALAEPIVSEVVEAFGWDRVMFGSNWPVATAVIGYRDWVEMLNQVFSRSPSRHLDSLFGETARRVYRI
jgi:L-fuconolactonase